MTDYGPIEFLVNKVDMAVRNSESANEENSRLRALVAAANLRANLAESRAYHAHERSKNAEHLIADLRSQLQAEMEHADRLASAIMSSGAADESMECMIAITAHAEWRKK